MSKLALKLSKIMSKIDRIPKNGHNDFHNYDYATEADVNDHCRKLMAEEGVVLIPNVQAVSMVQRKDKNKEMVSDITRLTVEFTFYDGESDEKISFTVIGDGQDASDKGVYKAFTGAQKYALMKSFLIPTGDDPEQEEKQTTKNKNKPIVDDVLDELPPPPQKVETAPNFKFLQAMDKEKKRVGEAQYYETLKVYGFEHSNQIVLREAQVAVYNALRGLNELAKQEPAQGEANGA